MTTTTAGSEEDAADVERPAITPPEDREGDSNLLQASVILSKTIVGAGIAAIPLTDAMLGWPLAIAFLLLMALATYASLDIIVKAGNSERSTSYPDVTRKLLGRWAGLGLELAVVAFGVGLMLVYEVVIGDMLVGKEGYKGLLCGRLGGAACNRPLVAGVVTAVVLVPTISFRTLESSALASWIGMGALAVWSVGTLVLLVAAIVAGQVQRVRLTPDWQLLGGSGIQLLANICAVIPILTTSYSCQAAAPFVLAELRPKTPKTMMAVSVAAVAITTSLYALISLGSYLVFGRAVQSDVLHNYTPARLEALVAPWLAQALYVVVRLSFLLGVLTLFPLMMFPARDGLIRIFSGRVEPLPPVPFYVVTYGIALAVYLVSVITPSIWGPIQIIGATAGAVIGFIIPGLLAIKERKPPEDEDEQLLGGQPEPTRHWKLGLLVGWALILIGILQSAAGIAGQILLPSAAK